MPGTRRTPDSFGTANRTQQAEIIKRARQGLGSGNPEGYIRNPEYAIRDAALLAWEVESGKRVSEFVGRKYFDDVYVGLTTDHYRISKVGDVDVLQFYIRILKRGRRKRVCLTCNTKNAPSSKFCHQCGADLTKGLIVANSKEVWKWKNLLLSDPFTQYILDWLNYLKEHNIQGRVFAISRQAAWTIMKNLGIMNHINRHWKATQLADTMTPYQLKEELDRATIPTEYVHGSPATLLEKVKEANEKWKG